MTNKIIVKASPVALYQTIYLWTEKGRETLLSTTQDLPKTLTVLAEQNNVKDIDLVGNDAYLLKIKNDTINNKYSEQVLNITINKSKGE
jgi:hypothetical protein